jgi:hypothetical protein
MFRKLRWSSTRCRRLPLTVRLLVLYPPSWRERYGEELAELLMAEPVTPAAILYVLAGALDAQLHRHLVATRVGSVPSVTARLRAAVLTSFWAVVGFVVAALAFAEAVNDLAFAPLIRSHTALRGPWTLLITGGVITLAAVLVGSLPILVAVWRDAWVGHRRDLRLVTVPPLFVVLALGCDAFEEARRHLHIALPQPVEVLLDITFHALFVLGAGVSTMAVCILVLRSTVSVRLFQFALILAGLATVAMGVTGGAAAMWLADANVVAPTRLGGSVVGIGFVVLVLLLAATTLLAAGGVWRGLAVQAPRAHQTP